MPNLVYYRKSTQQLKEIGIFQHIYRVRITNTLYLSLKTAQMTFPSWEMKYILDKSPNNLKEFNVTIACRQDNGSTLKRVLRIL